MHATETLEEFYKRKSDWIPDHFRNEIGHFNMFRLEPFTEGKPTNIPYKRRDFYKIMLVKGKSQVHFADKIVDIKKQALSFSNPQIPYKWEHLDKIREGVYCVFNQQFFHQFGQLTQYEVFQPNGTHIFELSDREAKSVDEIFEKIATEFNSEFKYKYDVIRNHIFQLLHFALKIQPLPIENQQTNNASNRISTIFFELLERQFPIDDSHQTVSLRTPSDFASQLNIHVNHLNRAVKAITQKTTTQIISERLVQESTILLRQSSWSVSEIAFALGFSEVTHFDNFFKKHLGIPPLKFRNV